MAFVEVALPQRTSAPQGLRYDIRSDDSSSPTFGIDFGQIFKASADQVEIEQPMPHYQFS